MSILDETLTFLQTFGLSPELSYVALAAMAVLVLFVLYKLIMMIVKKLRPEPFNNKEKENFPSMSELAARARQAASDAVESAKKLVGA